MIKNHNIDSLNNGEDDYFVVLFHISEEYTTNHREYDVQIGTGKAVITDEDYMEEFINVLYDDKTYYVRERENNTYGASKMILITDVNNIDEYNNQN